MFVLYVLVHITIIDATPEKSKKNLEFLHKGREEPFFSEIGCLSGYVGTFNYVQIHITSIKACIAVEFSSSTIQARLPQNGLGCSNCFTVSRPISAFPHYPPCLFMTKT